MRMKNKNVLIINYSGLGNGFMMLPILRAVERIAPQFIFYYMENLIGCGSFTTTLKSIDNR